ncbi:hypothetical protein ACN3XK_57880 [Actinomadura welshii]
MSGSRDTWESADEAGTAAVPADSVPPSFGGAAPPPGPPATDAEPAAAPPAEETSAEESAAEEAPAEEAAGPAASDSLRLPPIGLQAPWWAAESTETGPPEEESAQADAPGGEEPVDAPEAGAVPPGTLVAGVGVPNIDSRGAVPADPIVKRPLASGDTDPDGFPAVRPEDAAPEDAVPEAPEAADPGETAHPGTPEDDAPADETPADASDDTATDDTASDDTAVDIGTVEDTAVEDTAVEDTVVDGIAVQDAADTSPAESDEASAFEKARAAEDATVPSFGQVLEPDAILPVGITPPTGSGPFPQGGTAGDAAVTAGQPAVITPVYHAEGGVPLDTPPPPGQPAGDAPKNGGSGERGGSGKRRTLLIGGGAAAILAAAAALFAFGGTDSDGGAAEAKPAESPAAVQPTPAATPSPTAPTAAAGPPSRIDNEKTDREPLAFRDVFPTETIALGGRTYTRDRWSLNRDASYAARGSMLAALERENCRKIIRATFIDRRTSLAVTSGIAVMPTKDAALRISRAGDPAAYEWFRGMGGKHTPNLDKAGGYAAATVRGRYVAYAYVQWANGKEARPGDPVIKQAAQRFLDYDLRPIVQRARR